MPSRYIPCPPRRLLHLPVKDWPEADRLIFERAFADNFDLFAEGGQGRHYAGRTRISIIFGWRRWLGWIERVDPLALALEPAERITPDRVKSFTNSLAATNQPLSIANALRFLRNGAQLANPFGDWQWLNILERRFAAQAGSSRRLPIPFNGRQLLDLGLGLMDRAVRELATAASLPDGRIPKQIAVDHRDGLLLAILSFFPLRRSNVENLTLGENVVGVGGRWQIRLRGDAVKNHEALDATLTEELSSRIDEHLEYFRPMIYRSDRHRGLWASVKGRPACGQALYETFTNRILALTGHKVRLHDVRAIAVTTWALEDPEGSAAARDLLGNRDPRIIEKHYNRAQAIQASRVLARLTRKLSTKTKRY